MSAPVVSSEQDRLVASLRILVQPWRKLTIAIDGRDHTGKSTLARYLAWQLDMPLVETDFALVASGSLPRWDTQLISRLLAHRHSNDRPVLVEGVFLLQNLAQVGIAADFVVRVTHPSERGSLTWAEAFADYETKYYPCSAPSIEFVTPVVLGN